MMILMIGQRHNQRMTEYAREDRLKAHLMLVANKVPLKNLYQSVSNSWRIKGIYL